MVDLPEVGPGVVLVVVVAGALAAGVLVVEGQDPLPVAVLRVEEAGVRLPELAVVERPGEEELRVLFVTELAGELGQAPGVVGGRERDRDGLPLLALRHLLHGLRLARMQRGEVALLPVETVQFGRWPAIPRDEALLAHRLLHARVGALEVETANALAPRIRQHRHRVLPVHAVRIAEHRGKGRHPARLFAGADVRRDLLPLRPGVEEDLQRVQGVEGVPDPVVGPERHAAVVVHLAVPGAEIASVLGDGDHPLVRTVERRVEDRLLVLGSAFDRHLAKGGVPLGAGLGGQSLQVEVADLGVEVPARLVGADVRDRVAQPHATHRGGEGGHHGLRGVAGVPAREVEGSAGERPRPRRRRVELAVEVDADAMVGVRAGDRCAVDPQRPLSPADAAARSSRGSRQAIARSRPRRSPRDARERTSRWRRGRRGTPSSGRAAPSNGRSASSTRRGGPPRRRWRASAETPLPACATAR